MGNEREEFLGITLRPIWLIALIALVLSGAAIYQAPRFLTYSDKPVKSDAIVLFVGVVEKARDKEAARLLYEGYGKVLIIPSYRQVISHEKIPLGALGSADKVSRVFLSYPRFRENTHIEMLYAKKAMDAMGLRSAIMVSSPYHMERIRLIAGKVFGEQSRFISYVPTRYESDPVRLTDMDRHDWRFVISECIKICWFSLYSHFVNN